MGVLQPDGAYLVSQDAEGGERFGVLEPFSGDFRWLTGPMSSSEGSWLSPVGLSGDELVLQREWDPFAEHDPEEGIVLAHDASSGTTIDLTQSEPGSPGFEFVSAHVVGDHVYWVEGDAVAYGRELSAEAEPRVLTKDAWIDVDSCLATSAGRTELFLSRGADTVRLGEDGVLRPLGPDELAPGFDRAGPTKLECAGWSVEQLEDEGGGERLEITDGEAVTQLVAPGLAYFSVGALSESWLAFHVDAEDSASVGLQLVYDRKGRQLYRVGAAPHGPGVRLVLDGEIFAFAVPQDPENPDGDLRRILGRLSSPVG